MPAIYDLAPIKSRSLLPTVVAVLVVIFAGCAVPCPNGSFEGNLVLGDDQYYSGDGWGGRIRCGPAGGSAGIQACREILGALVFTGNVSTFSDLDGLEYVAGGIRFSGTGYPERDIDGRTWEVMEGMNSLERVELGILGGPLILGMNSLEYTSTVRNPTAGLFSLREVPGDVLGPGVLGMSELSSLEYVGGELGSAVGDFENLSSLRIVAGDLHISFAEEVNFSPPVLEEVGGDLTVTQNDQILDVAVPALGRVGGRLTFSGNRNPTGIDITQRAREAFENVDVGEATLICRNRANDPCPYDPECWEIYDENYCCPIEMGTVECIETL